VATFLARGGFNIDLFDPTIHKFVSGRINESKGVADIWLEMFVVDVSQKRPKSELSASRPLYGGIKTINREVGWQRIDLNDLFAAFLMRFPQSAFRIFASGPLAQSKIADLGCQKLNDREVGWQ
jgi:hypothetical protein